MKYTAAGMSGILRNFQSGRSDLDNVEVEIVGGENDVDAATLLRAYDQKEASVDVQMMLASRFYADRCIRFHRDGKQAFEVFYKSGTDLSELFDKAPWYLDIILKLAYTLMLKKLTPPSNDSAKEERPSA